MATAVDNELEFMEGLLRWLVSLRRSLDQVQRLASVEESRPLIDRLGLSVASVAQTVTDRLREDGPPHKLRLVVDNERSGA